MTGPSPTSPHAPAVSPHRQIIGYSQKGAKHNTPSCACKGGHAASTTTDDQQAWETHCMRAHLESPYEYSYRTIFTAQKKTRQTATFPGWEGLWQSSTRGSPKRVRHYSTILEERAESNIAIQGACIGHRLHLPVRGQQRPQDDSTPHFHPSTTKQKKRSRRSRVGCTSMHHCSTDPPAPFGNAVCEVDKPLCRENHSSGLTLIPTAVGPNALHVRGALGQEKYPGRKISKLHDE